MGESKRWIVCRLDDNGNEFVVARTRTLDEAEALVAEFEARGHKQTYWVDDQPLYAGAPGER